MIRLIATDLDGTLLYPDGELPEGIFEVISALQARGVRFAAASGRQYGNLKRLFAPVWREMAFISENGGQVAAEDWRETQVFPRPMAEEIIRDILDAGLELLISAPETCYMLSTASRTYTDDIIYHLQNTCTITADPFALADTYIKISGFSPRGVGKIAPPLQEKWQGRVHADVAGANWLDFTLANKGTGMECLSRRLQIPLGDMAAFGDQFNDESMLRIVGHPYIMAHAPEELRGRGFTLCHRVIETLRDILGSL